MFIFNKFSIYDGNNICFHIHFAFHFIRFLYIFVSVAMSTTGDKILDTALSKVSFNPHKEIKSFITQLKDSY